MVVYRRTLAKLGYALRLIWESSRGVSVAHAGVVIAQAALSLGTLVLLKLVIDAVTAGLAGPEPAAAFGRVGILIGFTAIVAVLSAACGSLDTALSEVLRERVSDHLQELVHAKSGEVDLEHFENAHFLDTLHRAQIETPARAANVLTILLQVVRSAVMLVAIAGLLFTFSWWIVPVLLIADLPGAIFRIRSSLAQFRWTRERSTLEREARNYGILLGAYRLAQEIRVFDLVRIFSGRFRAIRQRLRGEREQLVRRRVAFEALGSGCAAVAMLVVFSVIAQQALAGTVTVGDVVMYFAAFQRGNGQLHELLHGTARFYESSLYLTELSEFLALEPKIRDPEPPKSIPDPLRTGITVERVTFTYPGSERPALRDVSLHARPGERIAIVGANGSGKTTLVKLLCRFYDPERGRITVDGTSLGELSRTAWWKNISVFFQEHGNYYLSARDNIAMGDAAGTPDAEAISAAARRSDAHKMIERLPHGYDTVLGSFREHNAELSAGEWQKVALARTQLREAPISIYDEPTSMMDVLSEQRVLESIWNPAPGRITILISHRLSAVRLADRIYVLADGCLAETGTHDELMRLGGTYSELFSAQAVHYR
ncbi:MAG TPA: ABC transporter ATP-binding protein [Burkholderiales bacterium]|nr:ABC transporter ATP-binding protein [Burkholderiales bacterium]